jgi:hypothetical protein
MLRHIVQASILRKDRCVADDEVVREIRLMEDVIFAQRIASLLQHRSRHKEKPPAVSCRGFF